MNGLDLFSGYGGISMGLRRWVRPIAYCEIERKPQHTLLERMQQGLIWPAPIWDDVRTLRGRDIPAKVDIVYGGFPCQDISSAGRGAGLAGERSGLYLELERIVRETKPAFVFLENVPAIRTRGLGRVVWGLSELGYDCRWTVVSAQEVGAPHLRKRWFLLAHAQRPRDGQKSETIRGVCKEASQWKNEALPLGGSSSNVADTESVGRSKGRPESAWEQGRPSVAGGGRTIDSDWWAAEPDVGRVAHGVALRVDRLRECGNGVVPAQVEKAIEKLAGIGG